MEHHEKADTEIIRAKQVSSINIVARDSYKDFLPGTKSKREGLTVLPPFCIQPLRYMITNTFRISYARQNKKMNPKHSRDAKSTHLFLFNRLENLNNAFLVVRAVNTFKHLAVFAPPDLPHNFIIILFPE